jgi:hypothetical protein
MINFIYHLTERNSNILRKMALSASIGGSSYMVRPYQPLTTNYSRPFSGNSFGSSQEYNFRMIPHDLMKSEPSLV